MKGVASTGINATVGGGYTNTAGALYATVGGGGANTASGVVSVIAGGQNNTASGDNGAVREAAATSPAAAQPL